MNKKEKRRAAQAVALQVKNCGCPHCSSLVRRALGTDAAYTQFFKDYDWDGK